VNFKNIVDLSYPLGLSFVGDFFIHNRHFSPSRRANLTASAVFRRIRGEVPQLHPPRLTSAASLTRELSSLVRAIHEKCRFLRWAPIQ
jgi:hypothetical protein